MVLIHVKRDTQKGEFFYETTVGITTDDLLKEVVELHNMRIKCLRTSMYCRDLGKHGPIRPEETRGISDSTSRLTDLDVNAYGKPTNPDEHGYRTGCPPAGETSDVLIKTADEVEASVSHTLVAQRKSLNHKICKQGLDSLYGAVMIAYPAFHRLPVYDPARIELENREELDGRSEFQDVMDCSEASIWWAGKELQLGKLLSDYCGKNEKTKIIARLTFKSSGAPVREPRIDENTHKAMLSYYYKKQEENKKLSADDDDSYLNSEWANSKALKQSLVGGGRGLTFK